MIGQAEYSATLRYASSAGAAAKIIQLDDGGRPHACEPARRITPRSKEAAE
jgi:hypothetical protein